LITVTADRQELSASPHIDKRVSVSAAAAAKPGANAIKDFLVIDAPVNKLACLSQKFFCDV
jgi:hypothetical protein